MKRILPFLLAVVFVVESALPAFATSTNVNIKESRAIVQDVWPEGIPRVLSVEEEERYKKMFNLQRRLRRSQVVDMLKETTDRTLYGHLIAERLLHPLTKVTYGELKGWLKQYPDLGPASNIYALAKRRKPKGSYVPKPDALKPSVARYSDPDAAVSSTTATKTVTKSSKRRKTLQRLRYYRKKGRYVDAHKLYFKESTKQLLGEETWLQVGLKLARYMLAKRHFSDAEQTALRIAAEVPTHPPQALWIAGFASYRLGYKDKAAASFRKLAYSVSKKSRYYARSAWWAGRSYQDLKRHAMARVFYNMAAQDLNSFYGMLANERLGRTNHIRWRQPTMDPLMVEKLMEDDGVRRVVALAQIGEYGLAQQELKTSYDRLPYNSDETLLAMSLKLNLAGTSLTLAHNLREQGKEFMPGLYPLIEEWLPENHIKIDPALMHAIVRQESAFKPTVKSSASARGLMQLMPATAKFIQRKNGERPYPRYRLNEPAVNTKLGQNYMLHLAKELDNNLLQMIAGYNAGPGNVRKWVKDETIPTDHPALFIESIPFNETKKYMMRVLANYWMYRKQFDQDNPSLVAMAADKWPGHSAIAEKRFVPTPKAETSEPVKTVRKEEHGFTILQPPSVIKK